MPLDLTITESQGLCRAVARLELKTGYAQKNKSKYEHNAVLTPCHGFEVTSGESQAEEKQLR